MEYNSFEELYNVASNPETPADILSDIIRRYETSGDIDNIDGEIFYALAKNPSTPPADLTKLREMVVGLGDNWDPTEPAENILQEINNGWKNKILDYLTNYDDGELGFYYLQELVVGLKNDKAAREELRKSEDAEVRGFIQRMDLAEDIAIETVLGGDRFDKEDIPYMVSRVGLTQKDITEFGYMTRHLIGTMGDNDEHGRIKQSYLDTFYNYWMPAIRTAVNEQLENNSKMLFLLGGHDLEMEEIKKMLDEHGIPYLDKNLSWEALGGDYKDILEEKLKEMTKTKPITVYSIELSGSFSDRLITDMLDDEMLKSVYHNASFKVIDHHHEYSGRKSSIEQVADIIGVQLNHHQQLVAANDSGYIPAMKEMGATNEEIAKIRRLERAAYGVTEAEEKMAEEAINKCSYLQGVIPIVEVPDNSHVVFAIKDKLFGREEIVMYDPHVFRYYGPSAKALGRYFMSKYNNEYLAIYESDYFMTCYNNGIPIKEVVHDLLPIIYDPRDEYPWINISQSALSESFLREFQEFISFGEWGVSFHHSRPYLSDDGEKRYMGLSEEFIREFEDKLDWEELSYHDGIEAPVDLLLKHKNEIDVDSMLHRGKVPTTFNEELFYFMKEKALDSSIWMYPNIPESIINRHLSELNNESLGYIFKKSINTLSIDFIEKHADKIDWMEWANYMAFRNKKFSDEVIHKISKYLTNCEFVNGLCVPCKKEPKQTITKIDLSSLGIASSGQSESQENQEAGSAEKIDLSRFEITKVLNEHKAFDNEKVSVSRVNRDDQKQVTSLEIYRDGKCELFSVENDTIKIGHKNVNIWSGRPVKEQKNSKGM